MKILSAVRLADLPVWDIVMNQEGFPLFTGRHTPHFAVIAYLGVGAKIDQNSIDWKAYKDNACQAGSVACNKRGVPAHELQRHHGRGQSS